MKYRDAIRIIDYVNDNDGALSLDPDDPSFHWLEARECIRRHGQRKARKGQAPASYDDLELSVTSDLADRAGVAAWEANALSVVVGPLVEELLADGSDR